MDTNATHGNLRNASDRSEGDQGSSAVIPETHERRQSNEHPHQSTADQDEPQPQPFSTTDHAQLTLDRGSNASTLRISPQQELPGSIRVDSSRVNVGETVGVAWDVSGVEGRFLNHMDFLGMFEVSEGAPVDIDNLIDSKLRGFNSSQSGCVNWLIQSDYFHGCTSVPCHVTN